MESQLQTRIGDRPGTVSRLARGMLALLEAFAVIALLVAALVLFLDRTESHELSGIGERRGIEVGSEPALSRRYTDLLIEDCAAALEDSRVHRISAARAALPFEEVTRQHRGRELLGVPRGCQGAIELVTPREAR